jgi:hypothetical protein
MKKILICSLMSLLSLSAFAKSFQCSAISEINLSGEKPEGGSRNNHVFHLTKMIVPLDDVSRVFEVKDHDKLGFSSAKNGAVIISSNYVDDPTMTSNFYMRATFVTNKDTIGKLPWGVHTAPKGSPKIYYYSKGLSERFDLALEKGDPDGEGQTTYGLHCHLID